MERIGLIAGNGQLPLLFADEVRNRGLEVVAVAHRGETDPALESRVSKLTWVKVGQLDGIARALKSAGVARAVMAGGIGRVRALSYFWPDRGAVWVATHLRGLRDDSLLRTVAEYFENAGISIVAPTDYLERLLAPEGPIAGPRLSDDQQRDIDVGIEVAELLGRADVGQTVVVKNGLVMALEAIEGTDEAIRRGGKLGGRGAVVVKLSKPQQDTRFDLPAVGPGTLEVMAEVGARALAVEAGKSIVLSAEALEKAARKAGISVIGVQRQPES